MVDLFVVGFSIALGFDCSVILLQHASRHVPITVVNYWTLRSVS
jgi:hypothetical protein